VLTVQMAKIGLALALIQFRCSASVMSVMPCGIQESLPIPRRSRAARSADWRGPSNPQHDCFALPARPCAVREERASLAAQEPCCEWLPDDVEALRPENGSARQVGSRMNPFIEGEIQRAKS
jgi:hypothetical protein